MLDAVREVADQASLRALAAQSRQTDAQTRSRYAAHTARKCAPAPTWPASWTRWRWNAAAGPAPPGSGAQHHRQQARDSLA